MAHVKLEDGRAFACTESGRGETVVLLHPIGLSGACWGSLVPALAAGYRVLAPDLAGHGGSDRPSGPYRIDGLADDVAELARARETGPVVAIGLSMGGMVALALAERHPDLVSAVVVINSAARVPEAMVGALRDRAERTREGGMAAVADETLARWFTPGFQDREPDTVAEIRGQLLAGDRHVHADAWLALAAADLEPGLAALSQPVLVVTGSLDPSASADTGARTAGRVRNGRHLHLDGAGHMSPIEEPARLADVLLAFLDDRDLP